MHMDRKKIVEEFFKRGRVLSEDGLDLLEKKDGVVIASFLGRDYHDFMLTQKHFSTENITILRNLESKPVPDKAHQLSFYTSKYEKMKNIIMQRLQKKFISINKLRADRSEVFVIGIIKEKREEENKNIIDIEDMTGTISVIFQQPAECELDDVAAIHAVSGGNVLFGKKIIYPDMPLRTPATGTGKACFVSDLHMDIVPKRILEQFLRWLDENEIRFLFVAGDVCDKSMLEILSQNRKTFVIPGNADTNEEYPYLPMAFKSENIISMSNPAMVFLNGLKILMIHDFDMSMLKKRYLGRSREILDEDYLALDEVPDIVHYGHTHKPFVSNYKSTTLLNSGSMLTKFMPVVVDFSTREWKQTEIPA